MCLLQSVNKSLYAFTYIPTLKYSDGKILHFSDKLHFTSGTSIKRKDLYVVYLTMEYVT